MKASELRIGNWIYLPSKSKEYQISSGHDIEEIEGSDDALPIPLTPEWLERFGFIKSGVDFVFGYGDVWKMHYQHPWGQGNMDEGWLLSKTIAFKCEYTWVGQCYLLNYVHQLQNLYFALTGEELTINEPVEK